VPGVEAALAWGAGVDKAIGKATKNSETPLQWAAQQWHEAVVGRLIKAGAAVDKAGKYGRTPLCCAAWRGHGAVVGRLIEAGAHHGLHKSGRK